MNIGPAANYVMARTSSGYDEDENVVYNLHHQSAHVVLDASTAPGWTQSGDMVAVWARRQDESGESFGDRALATTPDWVGVVTAYGDLIEAADRYRHQVAL